MSDLAVRADKLATSAMKGFESAHSKLTKANQLLDQQRAEAQAEAERWRAEVEAEIARQERLAAEADEAYARNQRRIAKMADFLEI